MSHPLSVLFPTRAGSIWLDRLLLLAGCALAAGLAISLRGDRPLAAAISTTEALQIATKAEQRHELLLAGYEGNEFDAAELAIRLEDETLPLWRDVRSLMVQSRRDGAMGRRFDELDRCYQTRLNVTEQMVRALRESDMVTFDAARQRWSESAVEPPLPDEASSFAVTIGRG